MPTAGLTTSNITTDEHTKTVTIRQAEYSLQQGSALKGYHHVIYATTVHVKKGFVNPGCNLTVYTAHLLVDSDGGQIDVSGVDGTGYNAGDRQDATGYKQGTRDGENGGDGHDGEPGQKGGDVTIYAGRIQGGPLELISNGGAGGRAQDGGHGKDGKQPPEQPKPSRPELVVVGYETVNYRRTPKYGWDDDVTTLGESSFWNAYLRVANRAKPGLNGGHGGHAGLAGTPGDGGRGGQITVRTLVNPAITITPTTTGGDAGGAAQHGTPGSGGAAGLGAKYLYKADAGGVAIDWSAYDEDSKWDEHWNTQHSKAVFGIKVDHFEDLGVDGNYIVKDGDYKKLKLRAAPGTKGNGGGYGPEGTATPPPIPPAQRGKDGAFDPKVLEAPGPALRDLPYPYLLALQRSATLALLHRDEAAADVLRWLLLLTSPYRNAAPDASDDAINRHRIYHETNNALLTIDRGAGDWAARCIYKDIGEYSDFVESSLDHVVEQERFFNDFQAAQEDLTARKTALDGAISETQDHITHLTGDTMTPGSIVYYQEKEKQIKEAIGRLDVQVLDYKFKLESMPHALQEAIDAKIREQTQITVWNMLEFAGMAAGVVVNFASAAGSIMSMVNKVKDFYKEALDLGSWSEIIKEGLWNREFTELKDDLKKLLDTDEWKNASKDAKAFITSVTDFHGKIKAYEEISKSRKSADFALDALDVQASVLVFDTAKLELKKQRNEFEAFIVAFLEDYQEARAWKHLFTDYFDTSETRFDLLAHLADVQAERREVEYQRSVYQRNLEVLHAQKDRLEFQPDDVNAEDARTSLETNVYLALEQTLNRIVDQGRAFTIWTLETHTFPPISGTLDARSLRLTFHNPLWDKIHVLLSSTSTPTHQDFSSNPYVWRREDYRAQFAAFEETGRITLSLPITKDTTIYFRRLIDAKVYLRGATTTGNAPFYCVLRHSGISNFLNRDRNVVTCYQQPRSIEFSYVVEGIEPTYNHPNAIQTSFDVRSVESREGRGRIRYSPYTTWEIQIIKNYQQEAGATIYNHDIDLSAVEAIELRYVALYNSFHMPKRAAQTRQSA